MNFRIKGQKVNKYKYKPFLFFAIVFAVTWGCWFTAAYISKNTASESIVLALMILGLFTPAVISLIFVLRSKSTALKKDYKNKIIGFYKINFKNVLLAIITFFLGIVGAILISTLFDGSINQLALSDGFSFSAGGASALLTIILASSFEEFGWRGYAEDSIANYNSWFKESLLFGVLWSLWHLPLIFIEGTYQYNILQMNPLYAINFFVSVIPLGFFMTWVYVANKRSLFACIIVHFSINFMQEQIAMTQATKCIQTGMLIVIAFLVVSLNKEMFFGTKHIGNLLEEE